jgi:crossover junction endodeoxyribonuclease RuvC
MRIISFDPGYERLGVAILEKENNKEVVVFSDCIHTNKKETSQKRIFHLGSEIETIFQKYKPGAAAIEGLFFTNNQKTAMRVAEVRGMLIFLSKKFNCEVFEYTPNQIKVAVTGNGRATKKDILIMVPRLVNFTKKGALDDEYDAIACGITCFACERFPQK